MFSPLFLNCFDRSSSQLDVYPFLIFFACFLLFLFPKASSPPSQRDISVPPPSPPQPFTASPLLRPTPVFSCCPPRFPFKGPPPSFSTTKSLAHLFLDVPVPRATRPRAPLLPLEAPLTLSSAPVSPAILSRIPCAYRA